MPQQDSHTNSVCFRFPIWLQKLGLLATAMLLNAGKAFALPVCWCMHTRLGRTRESMTCMANRFSIDHPCTHNVTARETTRSWSRKIQLISRREGKGKECLDANYKNRQDRKEEKVLSDLLHHWVNLICCVYKFSTVSLLPISLSTLPDLPSLCSR